MFVCFFLPDIGFFRRFSSIDVRVLRQTRVLIERRVNTVGRVRRVAAVARAERRRHGHRRTGNAASSSSSSAASSAASASSAAAGRRRRRHGRRRGAHHQPLGQSVAFRQRFLKKSKKKKRKKRKKNKRTSIAKLVPEQTRSSIGSADEPRGSQSNDRL